MLRYYTWAVTEKTLGIVPGGKAFYRGVGRVARHRTMGTGGQLANSYPLARKAAELVPPGGTILDLGTGWFHHDAFLLHLAGDWRVVCFDIEDRARLPYIRNYLRYLRAHLDDVCPEIGADPAEAAEKLDALLALPTRAAIYDRCGFELHTTDNVTEPFLPRGSVDLMVSNCVLVHVREAVLLDELVALREMLADDGAMYHFLGHDDHWAFHDASVAWPSFNYLRYSPRGYRMLFDTKLEYHNRLVKPEWLELFDRAGLDVLDYDARVSEESRRNVATLPRIDERYAGYPLDDLAVYYSYVLLAKQPAHRAAVRQGALPSVAADNGRTDASSV